MSRVALWSDAQMSYQVSILTSPYSLCHLSCSSSDHHYISIFIIFFLFLRTSIKHKWAQTAGIRVLDLIQILLLVLLDLSIPLKHPTVVMWKWPSLPALTDTNEQTVSCGPFRLPLHSRLNLFWRFGQNTSRSAFFCGLRTVDYLTWGGSVVAVFELMRVNDITLLNR